MAAKSPSPSLPSAGSLCRCWRWILLVMGLLAFPQNVQSSTSFAARAAAAPDCSHNSQSRYKALVCWLWKAKISLPNEKFHEEVFTISVNDMTCTNFQVASMKSSSTPSSTSVPNPSAQMNLQGMSASCTGKYALGGIGMAGNIVASVSSASDGPSLHLQVDVASKPLQEQKPSNNSNNTKASLPFPSLATLSACQPNFLVHDVQFSGSASAHVIGLFSGVISKKVTSSINENLCPLIKKNGESLINQGFHAAREYIGSLILDTPMVDDSLSGNNIGDASLELGQLTFDKTMNQDERHLIENGNTVSWDKDMAFAKRILLGANNFVSKHLNDGILLGVMQKLSTWQSMTTADCEDCGFFFKGFNGLVNSLTKGAGSFDIPIPEKFLNFHHNHTFNVPSWGDIILTAHKVKVAGINNFTDLALFHPKGQNLLSSSIASDAGFNVSLLVDLEVRPAGGAMFQGNTLNETFELHITTSNVNFSSDSAWEVDQEMFHKLSVGSFIYGSYSVFDNNRSVLNCIIEALSSVVLLNMQGRINLDAVLVSPVVPAYEAGSSPSLEDNIDELINNVLQLFLLEYPTTTTETVAVVIQTPVRKMLNDGLANLIGDTKKLPLHCVNVDAPKNKSERPLRLDSNKALMFFNDIVNDESSIAAVNAFISCVDNAVETNKLLAGHFYNFSMGPLNVVLHDLHMENTNSVYELELLKPEIDHYHLANSFGYGMCSAKDCTTTSFSFGINLAHSKQGYLGNINVHINMKNLRLQGGTEIRFDMNYLPSVLIHDLLAHPQCASTPITSADFYGLNATVEMLDVKIDVNLNSQNGGPRSFTYQTENSTELASDISTLMAKGSVPLQEALGDEFQTQLNQAATQCSTPVNPHRSYKAKRATGNAGVWTFLIVAAFIIGNAWLFLRGFKTEDKLVSSDENSEVSSDEQQESSLSEPLLANQNDEMDENLEVETPRNIFSLASSSSLMNHESVHPAVKYGLPAVLTLAFTLFFSSNLTIGASVDLQVTRDNGSSITSLINIYEFSLVSTMREMAHAGVYLLMLLILFCSGIWPYVKLALLMISWIASNRRLQPVKRERILYLLDSLGKFSLIDAYVLVLMMVAFRYNLDLDGVGSLDVYVTPKFGFYSFLFATIVSLISGHMMLFLHRKTMLPSIPVYSGRYESLSKHIFDDKHGRGLVKLTKRFRRTIVLTLFLAFVLICVGVGLKSFHFKFNGVAGTALGDDSVRSFSLVSIGEHIPQSVHQDSSSSFGIYYIQTCYFFFALVMPLVCLVSLLALFLVPMRLKRQQRVFVLAEIANAWSAIEVFVIAIIASLVEISPFSESMVGTHCSLLNQILSGWSGGEGDDLHYCFDVKSSIDGSSAVLIIGVVLNSMLVSGLHRFAHHAIWERIEREDRPDATEDENKTVRLSVLSHTFISKLRRRPRLAAFMFEEVSFGPQYEEIDFENVTENEELHTSNNFWSEWTKIVSVI
ncbi:hypothetical protein ACHAXR_013117 [Thalassiosira sp. AJA248-18]